MGGFSLPSATCRAILLRWKLPWGWRPCRRLCLVTMWQEKLLEKLNLDGLSNLTPWNAAAAWDLVLAFHDIFVLEGNELGCTSAIEHEICITDSEPFKEQFRYIPPLLLEEVHTLLWDMLYAGAICPSQSPWCNVVVLVRKKDGSLCFCVDFCRLNEHTKKDVSFTTDPGGIGEYGWCHAFFHNGFQKQIMAGQNGPRVQTIYCFHHGKPGVLQVYSYALGAL